MWDQPHDFPWTMGFQPSYQTEPTSTRSICWRNIPRRQDRDPLSGRRFRQRLCQRPEGRARRQDPGRRRGSATRSPTPARSADRHAQGLGRRHLPRRDDPEICHDGDQAHRRARLEARAYLLDGVRIDRGRDAAGRPAKCRRASVGGIYLEGDDPAAASDPAYREWSAFMDRYLPEARKSNSLTFRLRDRQYDGRCAQEMRRRSVPRQHHEAGGLAQGPATSDADPGHRGQYQRKRPRAARADADDAIHRRAMGTSSDRCAAASIRVPSAIPSRRSSATAPPSATSPISSMPTR